MYIFCSRYYVENTYHITFSCSCEILLHVTRNLFLSVAWHVILLFIKWVSRSPNPKRKASELPWSFKFPRQSVHVIACNETFLPHRGIELILSRFWVTYLVGNTQLITDQMSFISIRITVKYFEQLISPKLFALFPIAPFA